MNCKIFTDYIVNCTTNLQVNVLLQPASEYTWVITDKFDKEYSGFQISDGDGFLSIPVAGLPEGLLNSYGGEFNLRILQNNREVNFKIADWYDQICFTVKPGPREKNNLGVDFACNATSGGGGNSAVFPFTNVATLHIDWTDLLNSLYGSAPTVQVYLLTAPNTYELANVSVTMNQSGYVLDSIDIDLGGLAEGYVLLN